MKTQSPLMSFEAHGTIGKILTFSERKTCHQARYQKKQKDSLTADRIAQRQKFLDAIDIWNLRDYGISIYGVSFFGMDIDGFEQKAMPLRITGYNLFMREMLKS